MPTGPARTRASPARAHGPRHNRSVGITFLSRTRDSKGYVTNLAACPDGTPVTPRFVIGVLPPALPDREELRDGQKRPAGPAHLPPDPRDSIEADLTIVLAALAVSRWIEASTGWSIRKFVRTARRYRTIQIHRPATTPSPPPTRYPITSATPSTRSAAPHGVRTSLAEVQVSFVGAGRPAARRPRWHVSRRWRHRRWTRRPCWRNYRPYAAGLGRAQGRDETLLASGTQEYANQHRSQLGVPVRATALRLANVRRALTDV